MTKFSCVMKWDGDIHLLRGEQVVGRYTGHYVRYGGAAWRAGLDLGPEAAEVVRLFGLEMAAGRVVPPPMPPPQPPRRTERFPDDEVGHALGVIRFAGRHVLDVGRGDFDRARDVARAAPVLFSVRQLSPEYGDRWIVDVIGRWGGLLAWRYRVAEEPHSDGSVRMLDRMLGWGCNFTSWEIGFARRCHCEIDVPDDGRSHWVSPPGVSHPSVVLCDADAALVGLGRAEPKAREPEAVAALFGHARETQS